MLASDVNATHDVQAASLVAEYGPLEKLAASGDAAAARQLAADFRRCEHVASLLAMFRQQPLTPGQQSSSERERTRADLEKDEASLCAGYDESWRDGRVYQVLWQAADVGDWDSAACYVAAEYGFQPGKYADTDVSVYNDRVQLLLERSIRQGQWAVVAAVFRAMTTVAVDWPPMSATIPGGAMQAFSLQRLIRLGADASDPGTRFLDKNLALSGGRLTAEQQVQAEQWAEDIFRRYFSASPRSTSLRTACSREPYGFNQL